MTENLHTAPTPPPLSRIVVSAVENLTKQHAVDVTLEHFATVVSGQRPSRVQDIIEALRAVDKRTAPETYKSLKLQLPAVTISVHCEPGRSFAHHDNQHTGVICIDIDGDDNPAVTDWDELRNAIGRLPWVYLSALSCGGRGVFALIATRADQPHPHVFAALQSWFASRGVTIDPQCKNINRARTLSYDPAAIIKCPLAYFNAPLARLPRLDDKSPIRKKTREIWGISASRGEARAIAAANLWSQRGIALDDYGDWYRIAAALSGLARGAEIFDQISRNGKGYSPDACAKQFAASKRMPGITLATFFWYCHTRGITENDINNELKKMNL